MELEFIIQAKNPPNAGKKNYCFGPLGHLMPILSSVVQELSQLLCTGQPAVLVLADATAEVLQQESLSFFFLAFISYYFIANCYLKNLLGG